MTLNDYSNKNKVLWDKAPVQVKALLARIDPLVLYPPFFEKLLKALQYGVDDGHLIWVTCGERTWDEQKALYAKGRRGIAGEGIVTKVDAGGSVHNFWCVADGAYDLDPQKPGLQPSWEKPGMKIWADNGLKAGLDAGFYWKNFFDGPHLQLNIGKYDIGAAKTLKPIYLKGGKLAVFQFLDKYQW